METSNVFKVGGGILGTGAVVGSVGYGVASQASYKNLREKFEKEGKIILKIGEEKGHRDSGTPDSVLWQFLLIDYKGEQHKDKRFKDLPNLNRGTETELQVLQSKCTSVLDAVGFEYEVEAELWCTRSSSLLKSFLNGPSRPIPSE